MDPSSWKIVGKGVDSPENHTSQEGALCNALIFINKKTLEIIYINK
jgi:hypothetical protein